MKTRRHARCTNSEDRKLIISVSLTAKELEKVDRTARRRGFKSRSEFVLWAVRKYV